MNEDEQPQQSNGLLKALQPPPLASLNIPKGKIVALMAGSRREVEKFRQAYPSVRVHNLLFLPSLFGVNHRTHVLIRLNGWQNNPLVENPMLDANFPDWRSTSEQCLLADSSIFDGLPPEMRPRHMPRIISTPPDAGNPFYRHVHSTKWMDATPPPYQQENQFLSPAYVRSLEREYPDRPLNSRLLLVIAGCYDEAHRWEREANIPRRYYECVWDEHGLRGYNESNAELVLVGSWENNQLIGTPYLERAFPNWRNAHRRPLSRPITITLSFDPGEIPQAIAGLERAMAAGMRQAADAIAQLGQAMAQVRPVVPAEMMPRSAQKSCRNCGYFVPGYGGHLPTCNANRSLEENMVAETECSDWAEPRRSTLKITRVDGDAV